MLPAFPKFMPLTLDDRQAYDALIAEYPPFSDISFTTLQIWWNLEGKLSACLLNGNLVLNYYQPFDKENSGISLIGKNHVEASMNQIFRYLADQGKPKRLVHVPEFVIKHLRRKQLFRLTEEIDYNEYILDTKALVKLEGALHKTTRWEINNFLRNVEKRNVEIHPLDMSSPAAKETIMEAILAWEETQPTDNDPGRTERDAIKKAVTHAEKLELQHLGLYIDGTLYAVVLYHYSHDRRYYIVNHLKVDYSIPYIFDYMTQHLASRAMRENIDFLNYEMDLGIENLRQHKMRLRPVEFFRKYTVIPAPTLARKRQPARRDLSSLSRRPR
jgi:hypothetical protein